MWRSETMQHGTLVLPADRARDFIEILGTKTHIQFVDMNVYSMKRQYRRYVQRVEEMERILRFLHEEIKKLPGTKIILADVDTFIEMDRGYQLDNVEQILHKLYDQFRRFQENNMELTFQKNQAIENRAVARVALNSLKQASSTSGAIPSIIRTHTLSSTASDEIAQKTLIGFINIAGVIATSEQDRFARAIFRATRGNAFTFFEPVEEELIDAKTNKPVARSVFVIYFQSGAGVSVLKSKIVRLCQAYGVNQHQWPKSESEARDHILNLNDVIIEKSQALTAYEDFFASEISTLLELHSAAGGSLIEEYRLFCIKEKSIYSILNMFEGEETTLRADCWLPKSEEELVRHLLVKSVSQNQASAFLLTDKTHPKQEPPTYNKTTEFTEVFQSFVDTYGVPRYKELNPAFLTIISFPFLFGVMYGDIGHAACVLAFGCFLLYSWDSIKKLDNEILLMIGSGRYMIVIMACFALFAGFMYNDFFSLGLDLFGTRYVLDYNQEDSAYYKFDAQKSPYPFGLDPIWKGASNELLFTNSFKMKFAIVVGFIQMSTGIILKGFNTIFFKDRLSFFFEFIPQLLFMFAFVGFMALLILYKWITPEKLINGKSNKPLIITNVIEMCMLQTPSLVAFSGQDILQKVCFVMMVTSVPMMLLPKPLILNIMHKRKRRALKLKDNTDLERSDAYTEEHGKFEFGEIMIHQMIETIEFVLGTISNTASYLRLWALSLAHQQLSLVLFNMFIKNILTLQVNVVISGILLCFAFSVFAAFTFGVLLCMDTLECFLHALRLQWVEFQNKFYKADGYPFEPFNFKTTLIKAMS